MGRALKPAGVRRQDFAAPHRAVGTVAGAVAGYPDHRSLQLVLGHTAHDVGVVVLDPDLGEVCLLIGPAGAEVIRVEVAGDDFRPHSEDALHVLDAFLEELVGGQVLQVADVLADEGLVALGETHRALELSPAGQDRRQRLPEEDRHGNEAAERRRKRVSPAARRTTESSLRR